MLCWLRLACHTPLVLPPMKSVWFQTHTPIEDQHPCKRIRRSPRVKRARSARRTLRCCLRWIQSPTHAGSSVLCPTHLCLLHLLHAIAAATKPSRVSAQSRKPPTTNTQTSPELLRSKQGMGNKHLVAFNAHVIQSTVGAIDPGTTPASSEG